MKFSQYWIELAMKKTLKSTLDSISNLGAGTLNQLAVNDLSAIASYYTKGIGSAFSSVLVILFASVMLVRLLPVYSAVILVVFGVSVPIGMKMLQVGKLKMKHAAESWAELNGVSTDLVSTHMQIKVLGIGNEMLYYLSSELNKALSVGMRAYWVVTLLIAGFLSYIFGALFIVSTIADHLNLLHSVSTQALFAFLGYLLLLFSRISSFSSTMGTLQGYRAKKERFIEFLSLPEDDEFNPSTERVFQATLLEVNDLSAGYGDAALFSGVSFSLTSGDILLVRGQSGCGKTTLLRVLFGIHPKKCGSIQLDGKEVKGIAELARSAVMLPQEIRFYSGSLRWNIEVFVGKPVEEAQLDEVLTRLGLSKRLGHLVSDSIDLKEAGANLSGGEKQRLALAAILLREPRVLLLDEPTSQIDADSERIFLSAIKDMADKGCIVVLVAHKGMAETISTRTIDLNQCVFQNPHRISGNDLEGVS